MIISGNKMTKKKSIVFLDGKFTSSYDGLLESLLPWNLKGKGVFETMRAYEEKIFLLEEHLDRLQSGLKRLNIKIFYPKSEIEKYLDQIIQANGLKNARLRLCVWQEENRVRISIIAAEYRPPSQELYQKGFKAFLSSVRIAARRNCSSVKSIRYLPYIKSAREAEKRGCHEAVLLNQKGEVMEGSRSNLFFVYDGKLFTPALKSGCLNGITRQVVVKLAANRGLPVKSVVVKPRDLFKAEEIFITNSLIELMPLTQLNGRIIGKGKKGLITAQLLKDYRQSLKQTFSLHFKRRNLFYLPYSRMSL